MSPLKFYESSSIISKLLPQPSEKYFFLLTLQNIYHRLDHLDHDQVERTAEARVAREQKRAAEQEEAARCNYYCDHSDYDDIIMIILTINYLNMSPLT